MNKHFIIFIFIILFCFSAFSQNYQTVEEVNSECAQLGFKSNADAEIAVDEILNQLGLARNFVIVECPDIKNAIAKIIENKDGEKQRFILYDNSFFEGINKQASSDWAATSILAHEIGHHLNNHSLNNKGSNHKFELEADEFSGFVLAKMGATLEQSQSALATLKYEKATYTHPAKADRLERAKKGWNRAMNIKIVTDKPKVNTDKPANEIKPQNELDLPTVLNEVPFSIVESAPVFPGCNGKKSEIKKCLGESVQNHIKSNFDTTILEGSKSKYFLTFKINQYGLTTDIKVHRETEKIKNEFARVLSLMPKMKPATQRGEPVTIVYSIPFVF